MRVRRAIARAGVKEHLPTVRDLLKDPDPAVRLRAGLALANLFEKEPIPVLIDLLPRITAGQQAAVEDLLYHLAGEKAPAVSPGSTPASREAYRRAWADWWKDNGAGLNMVKALSPPDILGYTMVVLLDEGNTIPFITRYRKEATGGLDEEQLRTLAERLQYLRNLEARREEVRALLEQGGHMTE